MLKKTQNTMKIKLLTLFFFLTIGYCFSQTETITIPWDLFSVPATDAFFPNGAMFDTDITIEIGDTVTWEWVTAGTGQPHNVKSVSGQAAETFGTPDNSGDTNTTYPAPYSYSYTFTVLGVNDFICTPHANIMYGSVTVVPEGTLSIGDFQKDDFSIYPNPSNSKLNISLAQSGNATKVEVFDVLGKLIYKKALTDLRSSINVASWNSGVYLVKIINDSGTQTKRFVRQ